MFKFGRKEGNGLYRFKETNDEYHGNWKEDTIHGKCKILFGHEDENSFVDKGEFVNGTNKFLGNSVKERI
jgi:hypothetical protein